MQQSEGSALEQSTPEQPVVEQSTPEQIESILGYSIDFVQVSGGWVAEWINYNTAPAPVRATPQEAAVAFLEYLKKLRQDSPASIGFDAFKENTNADNRSTAK